MPRRQHAVNAGARPRRTPAGDAASALAVQVLRLAALLTAVGDAIARPAGQSTARWQVLAVLENGNATVADVARALGLARQSVQRIADLLAGEGLAEFVENPDHRRAKLVRLTRRGTATLRSIQGAQRTWADVLGAEVGEVALARANPTLERVAAALATAPTPEG
jgi:DNA-binding MarR family transcriptional regulator